MAVKSGAKNTMHHAMALGRTVYAVPGPILSSTSRGCNLAIAEGKAQIVAGVDEVIKDILGVDYAYESRAELTALQQRVFDAVSTTTLRAERIGLRAGTTVRETTSTLGQLEAAGLVECRQAGWRRVKA